MSSIEVKDLSDEPDCLAAWQAERLSLAVYEAARPEQAAESLVTSQS